MTHINLLAAKGWGEVEGDAKEGHRSVHVPQNASWFVKLLAFSGPAYLVAVGYMDPGNWATDLIGGARYGYALLFVILLSSVAAMVLQYLSAKLGIATGRDLAQMCRASFPKWLNIPLWLISEVMIIACDVAEVIGVAIALELLLNVPLVEGILLTGLDVFLVLLLQRWGFRWLEAAIIALIGVVMLSLGIDVFAAHPLWAGVASGLVPTASIFGNRDALYIGLGIVGATVMPHNLFLHSSVVQTRAYEETERGKSEAIRFAGWDSFIALSFAFLTNAAILALAGTLFHVYLLSGLSDLRDAYWLMTPVLGATWAGLLFALALLASGQNATVTGTLAGQVVMEGFLRLRISPWLRRLITRGLAIVPALAIVVMYGDFALTDLLVGTQVVLSIALPFAMWPLVRFTSDAERMGPFVNSRLLHWTAVAVAAVITLANLWLLYTLMP